MFYEKKKRNLNHLTQTITLHNLNCPVLNFQNEITKVVFFIQKTSLISPTPVEFNYYNYTENENFVKQKSLIY